MIRRNVHAKARAVSAAVVAALLAGCAAAPVKLDYSGATQHGKFAGKKVAVVVKVAPDAKFLTPHCTTMVEKVCRTWTYSAALTTGAYASMLGSALKAEGADVVSTPAAADLVVTTTIAPTDTDGYLVLDTYDLGHTVAYNLVPFHHTRFYHQRTALADKVTETRSQQVVASLEVPVQHDDDYQGSTTVGGSDFAASVKLYKQEQGDALSKILPALRP